ncbi:protein kinase domain-containing protein [Sediminibacillus albus]|uniref:Serine/threonine protein kinase n=1 Tax=Sediminibacillus albus TaxID=407036 RepID=A0A1G9D9T6_9BACI|nr:serine/threonine protein kinase [Sediminibacillus albus]SDK60672.1 serine/threonine protein kinase [Sediminibacillus albus]
MNMNQTSKKLELSLQPGTSIIGKWHKNNYRITRRLGYGAIGAVYLCNFNGKQAALKISTSGSSITMEVNVLKTLQKVQGNGSLGPSLLDVDDWQHPGGTRCSFYVMEYVNGKDLGGFIQSHGDEWLGILMMQLLGDLQKLHQAGWVFGDLKTENLLVASSPPRIRWIDVGGTTQIGRSIKEYTEFYDRGYWKMGTRKAEPSYDLFALAMVMLQIYYPARFDKGNHPEKMLMTKLSATPQLKKYYTPIKKALYGTYTSSEQMRRDIASLIMQHSPKAQKPTRIGQRKAAAVKPQHSFMESIVILVTAVVFYLFHMVFI